MDIQPLLAFLAVAETGSFSGAARRLHLTQPAVSKRVLALEQELGVALFDRVGRGIRLTEAGTALLPVARRLRMDLGEARRVLAELDGRVRGTLRLVTSHHIGLHRLPGILRDYTRRYPEVHLELGFLDSEAAFQAVARGEYELAIVTLPPQAPAELDVRLLWQDPLPIAVSREHPLARLERPTPAGLSPYRALLPAARTVTRMRIEHWLAVQGGFTGAVMEVNYLETLRSLTGIGLGWSALPVSLLGPELKVLDFPGGPPSRELGIARNREISPSRAALAFEALLPPSSSNEC
ncbi:MAG: LysR family transcriptional regulator [Halothiobacillaceae bacterium]|nr:LysR family transcriptional regulator [Halothiobacillaceae bacterium]